MLFDVARLYERAGNLARSGEDSRDFAREVVASFWVQVNWNQQLGAEEAFRASDGAAFERSVAGLVARMESEAALPAPDTSSVAGTFAAFCRLARCCDHLLAESEAFAGTFLASRHGTFEDRIEVAHEKTECGREFSVIQRGACWQRAKIVQGSSPLLDFVLREHVVFPDRIFTYDLYIDRTLEEAECRDLFEVRDQCCARCYAGAYEGVRNWPEASGNYAGFAAMEGIDPVRRHAEFSDHLDQARADGASMILLPELTMTPDLVDHIMVELGDARKSGSNGPWIMPGTCHQVVSGKKRNRAILMAGDGRRLIDQYKMRPHVEDKFREDIDPGNLIYILNTPIGPMGIMICRDFCDDERPGKDVLGYLRITNILVPSMGDGVTEKRHLARINGSAGLNETRVLVAQQRSAPDKDNFLYGRCPGCSGRGPASREDLSFVKKWV